jgi:hypothetical protein
MRRTEATHEVVVDHWKSLSPMKMSSSSQNALAVGLSGVKRLRRSHIWRGPQYRCIPLSLFQCGLPFAWSTYW